MNKPNLNSTWLKIQWKNNDHCFKWKKNSYNKKSIDIKNVATLFKHKIVKFVNLTQKYPLIFKISNLNSKKNANKLTFFNKLIIIIPKKFKNFLLKTLKRTNLLVIIMNGFLKSLIWKIKLLSLKILWIKIKSFMMLC